MNLLFDSDVEEFGGTDLIDAIVDKQGTEKVKDLLACHDIDVNLADEYGRTPLLVAAGKGHFQAAKLLLACRNISVNARTPYGTTALMEACAYGHKRIVRLLLTCSNIEVNFQDMSGDTALTITARNGNIEILELLLAFQKLDFNLLTKSGHNALDLAVCPETKALLLARVIAPPVQKEHVLSPAHNFLAAARRGDMQRIQEFLKHAKAADVNYQDTNGNTALLNAVYSAHTDVVRILLTFPGIDVNIPHKNGYSALLVAASDQPAVAKMLLGVPSIRINFQALENGQTALIRAIANGQNEIVKILLDFPGVNVNLIQKNGYSALMVAARCNNDFVKRLLAVPGINVNLQNEYGQTALMVATYHMRLVIMRQLLACPEIPEEGKTALILSHQLADMFTKTNLTAMNTAKYGRIKSLLRVHAAEPCVRSKEMGPSAATIPATAGPVIAPNSLVSIRSDTHEECALATADVALASNSISTAASFGANVDTASTGGETVASSPAACAPIIPVTLTSARSDASFTLSTPSVCATNLREESVTHTGTASSFASAISTTSTQHHPTSWLAARLRLSGMSENLVVDCEHKLVHTEGFSNMIDFAECLPAEFNRGYLTSIGIAGLGTQKYLMRLHGELHHASRLLQSSQLPPQSVLMTPLVNHSINSTDIVADIKVDRDCMIGNTDGMDGADCRKRSRADAFKCDAAATEHEFVPTYPMEDRRF